MKKLRVIQIIDSLNVGGAEVLAVNTANELARGKIDSHICATRKEGYLKSNIHSEVKYVFLNRKKTFDFSSILKLRKYIKTNKINIIHAHSSSFFIAFLIKILLPNLKLIWHDHYGNSEFVHTRNDKKVLKFVSYSFSYVIAVNSNLKNWCIDNLHCKNVIHLNNFASFISNEKTTNLKGNEGKRIVHLAGFRPQKDHLTLLKSFKEVINLYSDWTLHLIGKNYQDDYGKSIVDFVDDNKMNNNVFFYGVKNDIKHILSQATIGVLSSKSEGLPISLLEYGLANLPVLVTDVGECEKVVKNDEALVKPNSYLDLKQKLLLLISDEMIRDKIKKDLHLNVIENYSVKSFISKLKNIYLS